MQVSVLRAAVYSAIVALSGVNASGQQSPGHASPPDPQQAKTSASCPPPINRGIFHGECGKSRFQQTYLDVWRQLPCRSPSMATTVFHLHDRRAHAEGGTICARSFWPPRW
jgi:hypothetical protein